MNILIDVNPETVDLDGQSYRINTDFRISILFDQLIQDRSLTNKEKMANAINLYFPQVPSCIKTVEGYKEVWDSILWFYMCGQEVSKEMEPKGYSKPLFCFRQDADYIYAAFLTQYKIDLQDEYLHWWKFRALMKGLTEEHVFSKIIGYRDIKITNDMSNEQKKFYREKKKLYEIPDLRTVEEIEEDFNQSMTGMF